MLVPLVKLQIVGRQAELERVLEVLQAMQVVQLDLASDDFALPAMPQADAIERERDRRLALLSRLDALLERGGESAPAASAAPVDAGALARELDVLAPRVDALADAVDALHAERAVLSRYASLLRGLLSGVPELELLGESTLASLRLTTVALVLSAEDETLVGVLRDAVHDLLGDGFWLASTPLGEDALGCVLVLSHDSVAAVQPLLGREGIRHLPLPEGYAGLSLRSSAEAMESRLAAIPDEIQTLQARLADALRPHADRLRAARAGLAVELERLQAERLAAATARAFVLVGWTPRAEFTAVQSALERRLAGRVVVSEMDASGEDLHAPVLMSNRRPTRPYQPLVQIFDTPRSASVDPTALMSVFLPLMFGLMVGDVVYGALMLAVTLFLRPRLVRRWPEARELSRVAIAGALWAIVFGVIFGEALGNAGAKLGMPALWMHRDADDAVIPLLLLGVAIGLVHVLLGLVLGVWQSLRDRSRSALVDHVGTLVFIAGAFLLAAVAAQRLPSAVMGPAVAAVIAGLVVVSVSEGALGLLMGPLELLGALTNVLSYLRLAAVGLASVYLAVVANELALAGPIWIGVVIGALLHALNLALAAFTPTVQALRLHYVEFFGRFFVGGGRPFRPFGAGAARS